MGELMDVLAPALSSVRRPKSHYRGRRLEADSRPQESGVRAHNETLFLLNLMAYEVLHAGRCVMHRHRLESAPVARAGAAGGQPGGPPWAAADVRHRPACRCRLATAVEQAGGVGLGTRMTPRGTLRSLPRASPVGVVCPPIRSRSPRTVRRRQSRPVDEPGRTGPSDHEPQLRSALSPTPSPIASDAQFTQLSGRGVNSPDSDDARSGTAPRPHPTIPGSHRLRAKAEIGHHQSLDPDAINYTHT